MEFINLYTKQTINTDDYLVTFVDEFTGEVKENRRVLDKRIRKLWLAIWCLPLQKVRLSPGILSRMILNVSKRIWHCVRYKRL